MPKRLKKTAVLPDSLWEPTQAKMLEKYDTTVVILHRIYYKTAGNDACVVITTQAL